MAEQDLGYKRLFAHREMVADLLSGFIREPWVAEVELDTLERVSGSYVSDDLREREDDIIWRVRWRGRWLYVTCCWNSRPPWIASWRCECWCMWVCCTRI